MNYTFKELKECLSYEKKLYGADHNKLKQWLCHEHSFYIWKYIRLLRIEEYFDKQNKKALYMLKYIVRRKRNKIGERIGLTIGLHVFEPGVLIWHYGSVVVSGKSKIGSGCSLHGQNCIGNNGLKVDGKAPVIGENVDIGVGASVIGDVYIANNVKIGAGAVVVKSCYTEGATLVGIPAHEIKVREEL